MIITVDELRDYMSDVTLTHAQLEAAEDVIAGVQSEIETYLNRPIELTNMTETVMTDLSGNAFFKHTPVASITSVAYNGTPLTFYSLQGESVYAGLIGVPLVVNYVGGLDGRNIPAIKLAVLRVASREMQNRHDDTLSVKDLGTNDVAPLPEGLQESDTKRIERYRRRVIV